MVNSLILVSPGIRGYKSSGPEEDREWEELDKREGLQDLAINENRIDDAVKMDLEFWASAQGATSKSRVLEIARLTHTFTRTHRTSYKSHLSHPPSQS